MCRASYQKAPLKNTLNGSTSTTRPPLRANPPGRFPPAVGRNHRRRPADAGQRDRDSAPEVRPRAHPVPTVDVDGDEDRLDEEEQALNGEGDAVRGAEPAHQPGAQ